MSLVLALSALSAFTCGAMATVVFPHWRRAACVALVLSFPIVASGIVAVGWWQEAPHLFAWGLPYIMAHLGAQVPGGLVGIFTGRPLARLTVRAVLPPTLRPRLAYLWLADGKPFPRAIPGIPDRNP
ncbi:MAG: hypothetical protein ABII12_18710 [Planctomycetota bacterium]